SYSSVFIALEYLYSRVFLHTRVDLSDSSTCCSCSHLSYSSPDRTQAFTLVVLEPKQDSSTSVHTSHKLSRRTQDQIPGFLLLLLDYTLLLLDHTLLPKERRRRREEAGGGGAVGRWWASVGGDGDEGDSRQKRRRARRASVEGTVEGTIVRRVDAVTHDEHGERGKCPCPSSISNTQSRHFERGLKRISTWAKHDEDRKDGEGEGNEGDDDDDERMDGVRYLSRNGRDGRRMRLKNVKSCGFVGDEIDGERRMMVMAMDDVVGQI
ncbi:hypothetical protein SISNIDRAFT_511379, partial [Sistotremastrum niveocremeum HHB9708]